MPQELTEGAELQAVERKITQDRIDRYASASGDFNPIHVDPEFAAGSQFGSTIAHGMMIAATVSEVMTASFEAAWLNSGRLKLRFRAPVVPEDTITAFGKVRRITDGETAREVVCSVSVTRQTGETAITGEATVSIPQDANTI